MRTAFKILAVLLLAGWFVSVFVFALGKLLHVLLVLAVIAFLMGRRRRRIRRSQNEMG